MYTILTYILTNKVYNVINFDFFCNGLHWQQQDQP